MEQVDEGVRKGVEKARLSRITGVVSAQESVHAVSAALRGGSRECGASHRVVAAGKRDEAAQPARATHSTKGESAALQRCRLEVRYIRETTSRGYTGHLTLGDGRDCKRMVVRHHIPTAVARVAAVACAGECDGAG